VPTFARDPWARYAPSARDLITRMLEKDPAERITAAAALRHPWFADALSADAAHAAAAAAAATVGASR
jgi:serine/threonine protein kinase